MLGFAVVLAISAGSMGFAYLGFERVSVVVDAYRRSVQEADLARDIDRELISYRALARYFVATGKEEDGKAALAAEAGLKDAIIASMKGTTNPGRLEQVAKLEREFRAFTKIFADILKVKEESARITQNQLSRTGNSLRYKLDDLPSNAEESELQVITLGSKKVIEQFQAVTAAANTFVVNSDKTIAANALARLKFVENSLKAISSPNPKIQEGIKEVSGMLEEYRQSLAKLIDNAKEIEELTQEMTESAAAINKGSAAMKSDLLADQNRLDAESDAAIAETERLILMLAAGGFLLGCIWAFFLGKGISRPMTKMCNAMRELAAGTFRCRPARPRPQGRTRRDGGRGGGIQGAGCRPRRARCRHAGSAEQGGEHRAPRRTDTFCGRFRGRGRRHRRQRFIVGRAARSRGRNTHTHRRNHPEPVEPGRRRLGRSLQQHAIGGVRDR